MKQWITGVIISLVVAVNIQAGAAEREWIEIKRYGCAGVEQRDALISLFDQALIPALNRQGAKKVGILWSDETLNNGMTNLNATLFVVAAFTDLQKAVTAERQLLDDAVYMREAAALFAAPMKQPMYDSCSSDLFLALATCPSVEQVSTSPERLFQLRIYNSYTPERNAKKISMFEAGGELALFRACGMAPVFFGDALSGSALPNLTYMLAFDNNAAKEAAWKKFIAHPEWHKLKGDSQYKDTANKIQNIVLKPSRGSQL
ncbi:MAG: NIPSNAP family protein [Kiritimatiellae bacterium]|nr:NIPSNAP family protein [Kiritimatiellia bacterium]